MIENNEPIKKTNIDLEFILVTVLSVFFVVAFVNRLFYGIETSDEAFYEVTGYRMLQGNIPFGDMWELNAADAYIMLPFLMIHKLVYGSMEGIQLFLRLSFMLLQFIGLWSVYLYASKSIKGRYAFLLGLAFWSYAPFGIYDFSYNNMSILFLASSLCMMFLRFREERKLYEYLTGLFMGLAVLVYPADIYYCLAVAIIIPIVIRSRKALKYLIFYVAGGLTIGAPVLAHLAVSFGLQNIFRNLVTIMSSDNAPSMGADRMIKTVYEGIAFFKTPFSVFGILFVLYYAAMLIFGLIKKTRIIGKFFLVLYPIICIYYCIVRESGYLFAFSMCVVAPVVVVYSDNRKDMLKKVVIEWGSSILIFFVIIFSSSGGVPNAYRSTIFAAIVALKLLIEVIHNDPILKNKKAIPYIPLTVFVCGLMVLFYKGIYRDNPYNELTAKVESGIYKGLYTTPERKQHILDLGNVLSQVEDKGETVMILYHSCYAYIMVDMVPKIASSWGCVDYEGYGYDNQDLMMTYLAEEKNIPDNIIIIDIPEIFDYAGQQVETYKPYYPELNQYILNHYLYRGKYENGLSGQVTKYEVDKATFTN